MVLKISTCLLSTPMSAILEFDNAPEALYERSWTGPMLFSMDCSSSTLFITKY